MKKTKENIKTNPRVAISVWDMETYTGYQFKGSARIETSESVFDDGVNYGEINDVLAQPKSCGCRYSGLHLCDFSWTRFG